MRRLLTLLPLVLLMSQPARAQDERGRQHQAIGFTYGNSSVGYRIFEADLADTPSWVPEQGEPPVALNEALAVARNNLRRFVQEADKLAVGKVDLQRFESDKWVYQVLFNCGGDAASDCGPSFWIIVKMDGTVLEPEFTANGATKKQGGGP
ncbi:MAG TPA: hypothetical protein VN256_23245 [Pyrinomonadaceae bacterium]|nr:hypothetical protein [Pyrinomonadaceae bacterium]